MRLLESVGDIFIELNLLFFGTLLQENLSTLNDVLKKVHILRNWVVSVSCLFDQLYKVGPSRVRYAKIACARQLEGEWFTLEVFRCHCVQWSSCLTVSGVRVVPVFLCIRLLGVQSDFTRLKASWHFSQVCL